VLLHGDGRGVRITFRHNFLLHDTNGRSALLVKRFDREWPTRIAQEDLPGRRHLPASKYRIKTEVAITTIADACARGGGSKVAAVPELLNTVVSYWLIDKGDLHGKSRSNHNRDPMALCL